jgi:GAF domain-containing protein
LQTSSHSPLDPGAAFAELGRIRLSDTDLDGVLTRIAELAKATLPGAAEVSVTLVRGTGAHTATFTGDLALELDEGQYDQGTGPCLEAAEAAGGEEVISVPDMATEDRWPGWVRRAHEAGVHSSLAIGLPLQEGVSGALNIYGARANVFDQDAIALAQTFARYAAVALGNAHLYDSTATLAEHMKAAMASRAVIEQAKGIIMGQQRCDADQAFAILTKISQDSNRKVRDVAAALVARAQHASRS